MRSAEGGRLASGGSWSALLGEDGFAAAGCPIVISSRLVLIFAKLAALLSDGDGLRQSLDWHGASNLKPCTKHNSVFKTVALACWPRPTSSG